ncbi:MULTISPECIES: helix-turn-helix domain-containing protein [Parafrankia]|uniref:helix-turn-helix domain-containing protein n=1 Tax=Parafrankia TaxID=2994362 RepID=UPI000B028418|nr:MULTISPECIES: helix-turn-helix domain-containing protein [Parafrankia]MBE3205712.1 helix-turn-helix domain-containing protein [Parafrankia sp. CH37]
MPTRISGSATTPGTSEERGTRLWTANDLARYLGVPINTIYKWRSTGEGPPAYRVGRYLRFDAVDVADWLEKQRSE